MGTKHHSVSDPVSDPKKRRRVGFSKTDAGVTPNECIKIYLVSTKEEVGSPDSFLIEPVDLNHFFEDEKIYGFKGLTITIWISSITFLAYADISFESTSDGGKGVTDLKSSLKDIFAENLVEKKEDFLQAFSTESDFINRTIASNSKVLQKNASDGSNGDSSHPKTEPADVEVLQVVGMPVGYLYSRLVPLVLLLIDGSNPIDVTDPKWEMYLLVRKDQESSYRGLLGFAAVYRFPRYPDGQRLRLGQILVIPPYQRKGYGRHLLQVLNNVAISENVYDLTIEEPVDSLQHVRTCIDVERLLAFDPIQHALKPVISKLKHENLSKKSEPIQYGPPPSIIEDVRKTLKINKKQFRQCWEILIYLGLDPIDKYSENYRTIISNRVKADVIGKESEGTGKRIVDIPTEFDQEMSFAMFKSNGGEATSIERDENQGNVEEQLKHLVDERMAEIELVAQKMKISLSHS